MSSDTSAGCCYHLLRLFFSTHLFLYISFVSLCFLLFPLFILFSFTPSSPLHYSLRYSLLYFSSSLFSFFPSYLWYYYPYSLHPSLLHSRHSPLSLSPPHLLSLSVLFILLSPSPIHILLSFSSSYSFLHFSSAFSSSLSITPPYYSPLSLSLPLLHISPVIFIFLSPLSISPPLSLLPIPLFPSSFTHISHFLLPSLFLILHTSLFPLPLLPLSCKQLALSPLLLLPTPSISLLAEWPME